MIKKLLSLVALVGIISISSAGTVAAYNPFAAACSAGGSASAACQDKGAGSTNPVTDIIGNVVNIVAILAGIAAVIIIIIAGISYITSQGDPQKIANAKNTIIYAAIGLVVIVLSRTIIVFVITRI